MRNVLLARLLGLKLLSPPFVEADRLGRVSPGLADFVVNLTV